MSDIQLDENQQEELVSIILGGRKIEAIKQLREMSGCSLKDAKDFVDDIEGKLREKYPDQFSSKAKGGGCSACLACLVALAGGIVWKVFC